MSERQSVASSRGVTSGDQETRITALEQVVSDAISGAHAHLCRVLNGMNDRLDELEAKMDEINAKLP